ncbi:hypothetical protein P7B02_19430 [Caulobacter segnis]|uniref:hypothetical protein n=1 Tax=Caulobacter segnis TaxID=88688 RepID=UPI00240ED19D|nr:hypothetical protein [Caulobacter segnis]MDG2523706.1 hypothetical protein [Caulobacter segnis]
MIALLATFPLIFVAIPFSLREEAGRPWRSLIANLRIAGPVVGLLIGGLNSFHMADTIQRLPFDPTLKQIAPGIFEVSTIVSLGAMIGLAAVLAHIAIDLAPSRKRTS